MLEHTKLSIKMNVGAGIQTDESKGLFNGPLFHPYVYRHKDKCPALKKNPAAIMWRVGGEWTTAVHFFKKKSAPTIFLRKGKR